MGSQKTKTSSMASGPGMGALTAEGPGRIEAQYQTDMANPNRLQPQAASYVSRTLDPSFLDPRNNPYFEGALQDTLGSVRGNAAAMFSRAGRGTSDSASGLGGYFTDAATRALAPTLAGMFQQNQGLQAGAAGMASSLDATSSLPLEQYLERMRGLATLGQQGTQTTTPSALQTIAGLGLTGAGLFSSPAGGTSAASGLSAMFSDRRLKTDVEQVDTDPRGFGVYSYRYLWDEPGTRRAGVMADEVAPILPAAVLAHPSGYLMVDYGAL